MKSRIIILLILFATPYSYTQTKITKDDYLRVIKEGEEKIWQSFEGACELWLKSDSTTRPIEPPKPHIYWGRRDGLLYAVTGEKKYAERARRVLLGGSGDNYYKIMILHQIENSGVLTKNDLKVIEDNIIQTADWAVNYWPEWGAMNHCTNHIVNALSATIGYLPHHPDVETWRQKRDINLSGSWGLWCIKDSQNYIPIWLKPLLQYVDQTGRKDEFYSMPMVKYYFDYIVQLMTPDGEIPEFGDGGPGSAYSWPWYISVLEKGASVYRDGKMKWAAHRLFESNVLEKGSLGDQELVEAYLWADDSISEEVPNDKSRLVLDDYVGKKVIFRNGWNPEATYLFLNFLEDAPFGIDGKEHIINTINVETEKNHHGHADENAICLLMKDGSVLLHDSGYRETSSTGPDGQYRADTYHNKLIVSSGLADSHMRLFPFLLDGGRYRFVQTKLMHFRRFKEVDISRTRLIDEDRGYQWDRLISYLKGKEWFVIFDIVKILKDGPYTLADLFYTQDIVEFDQKERSWYDTQYRTIRGYGDKGLPDNARLLVYFPEGTSFRSGVEQIRRCYQTESAVYMAKADSLESGDIVVFTTLLIPHSKEIDPKLIISSLSDMAIYHTEKGYGIKIPTEGGYIQVNAMLDLEAEYLTENLRPRYNFESGRVEYGDLVTDARYCYLHGQRDKVRYSFFKASRLILAGETIFQAQGEIFGQDDGSYRRWGVAKWVAWEDEVTLKSRR